MSLTLEAPKDWYPGTAISLGEMMRIFESHHLCRVTRDMERLSSMLNSSRATTDDELKDYLLGVIRDIRDDLDPLELPITIKQLDRMTVSLESSVPIKMGNLAHALTEASTRMEDELEAALVLQIPRERSPYFEKTDGFGSDVAASFPKVGYDLEEAHTCYALGRYNAAVYHLMRVLEAGVQGFGNDLGIKDAHKLTWGEITSQCHAKIKKLSAGPEKVQRGEAMNHLDGVRSVWRNNTMHPRPTAYTEPQARDILINAKALMVSLAEFL